LKVDNFSLEQFTCPAKYDLRIRQGIVPVRRKPSLGFGGVVHEGLAEWYRSGDEAKALQEIHKHWPEVMPSDDFRTEAYALKVMHAYVAEYPKEIWKPLPGPQGTLVEVAFTLDTGMFTECQECGGYMAEGDETEGKCSNCDAFLEPIHYGGIIDVGAEWGDVVYVVDHKTTTVLGGVKDPSKAGTYYFLQFKPDNQMTGYIWALNKLTNRRVGGAIINAIGIYEWLVGVRERCNAIKRAERTGIWRLETSQCMNYGQCEYHSIHVLNDPVSREKRIEQDYVKSTWDYENRDD